MSTLTSTTSTTTRTIPRRPFNPQRTLADAALILLVIIGAWSVSSIGINAGTLAESADNAVAFIGRMFPLKFPPALELADMVGETLAIVFLSTLLSVLISLPLAVWAASTTTSGNGARWTSRSLIVLARAIPDLVLAIIFMRMFGLGALGGILAMGIHSVGMVGKLYADAIEELDDGPRESLESAGGTRAQQIWAATLPQLLPQIIATALHRFDINLRTSVLLGYVGVGGIGMAIADSLRVMNYRQGMALALVVLILCIAVELLSGALRAVILSGGKRAHKASWSDKLWDRAGRADTAATTIHTPWSPSRVQRVVGVIAIVALTIVSLVAVKITPGQLFDGIVKAPATLALFFPPSSGGIAGDIFLLLLDTLKIAFAATFLGAILAIPIGIFAARNVVANEAVHNFFRVLIVIIRGIPELILAIIFVVISGLGAVAGTLALALGAVGLLSKLVADSLEETDTSVQEAITTAGASPVQVFFSATVRQAAPAFVAHTLYLLDTNIRSATLLGVVGAGGIGFQLLNASRVNQFDVVTYILILMVAVVLIVEGLSMWLRRAVR